MTPPDHAGASYPVTAAQGPALPGNQLERHPSAKE